MLLREREERKRKKSTRRGARESRAFQVRRSQNKQKFERFTSRRLRLFHQTEPRTFARPHARRRTGRFSRSPWMTLPSFPLLQGAVTNFPKPKKENLNAETRSERRNANDESRVPLLFADVEETEVPTKDAVLMVKPNIVAGFLGYLL